MASYDDTYGFDEDVAVYSFDDLQSNDLGGLLDEGLDDLNDETFGGAVGKDFDFAVSTSRLLDDGSQQGQRASLQQTSSSWLSESTPTLAQTPARQPSSSPWSTLDADPLLSSGPFQQRAQQGVKPSPSPAQNSGKSAMRTLDEIEAEMRAQAQRQQPIQQQQQQQSAPAPSRGLTLAEVEADMLRNARAQQQQQQQHQQTPVQQPAQQPSQTQQHPQQHQQIPAYPLQHPMYQSGPQQHQRQPFGPLPPGQFGPGGASFGMPGQPLPFPGQPPVPPFVQAGARAPPGCPPGVMPPLPQGPMSVGGQTPQMAPQMLQQQQQQQQRDGSAMMNTLFPPLPSQGGIAAVEQQLQFLTMNQHAQHPSLTGAQLHALLQQAQYQASREAAAPVPGAVAAEGGDKGSAAGPDEAVRAAQKAAGEQLIRNVEQRILEHEMIEQKRKSKANKIASMSKHNNLMSNSDKDFITRIQVSQLVTDDPYADDFYFHIMAAIKMSRHNAAVAAGAPGIMLPPNGGPAGPLGPGGMRPNGPQGNAGGRGNNNNNNRKPTRRENAMNRMAQNVQRLVDNAKQRNKSQSVSLDGALGKISSRTRSAPRQLLQVKPGSTSTPSTSAGTALLAGLISQSEGASSITAPSAQGAPLSHRAACAILERIYDTVLELEQLRRVQPNLVGAEAALKEQATTMPEGILDEALADAGKAVEEWNGKYANLVDQLWRELRVMEPLDSCDPHPFIALISVLKGKRILPRAIRHLSPEQALTLFTLIVATFQQLDTVRDAPLLDASDDLSKASASTVENKQKRAAVEAKTEAFLNAIVAPFMSVIGQSPLRMVTGMLGLLMDRNDLHKVVQSKPGIAFITIILSRAESLKQATPAPEAHDLTQWQQTFDTLFNSLASSLPSLFPSTRAVARLPFGAAQYLSGQTTSSINALRPDVDLDDEPVWRFLAAIAVCADPNEQQSLVTHVRDKVLENVTSAKRGKVPAEVAALKIRNVNLLLHSLGLDASQLTADE